MKYFEGKIKREHHILKDFIKFLKKIEKINGIQKIIPGRISRQQKGSSYKNITFSYFTSSGMKFNLKKGGTVQELFVVCNLNEKEYIKTQILNEIYKND